jgi:chemotaxis receptor (MCP) glutamine deamidase CheD
MQDDDGAGAVPRGLMGVSPQRKRQREEAADSLNKQAARMQRRAAATEGEVAVGAVVQIAVDDVDRAKVDDHNLTLIVVELVETGTSEKEIKYRLAGRGGVLKSLYTRSYIKYLPNATAVLMGLQSVLEGWRDLPQDVSIRTLAKSTSQVGGQGVVHCSCKGKCDKNTCSCFKAGRRCNSRCHKGSKKCTNHD